MAYVKLDTGIVDSTIWYDKAARDVFLTALLMAVPEELRESKPQFEVRRMHRTGWVVPPGWYGFVNSAGIAIVSRALVEPEEGLAALERLGSPEANSKSTGDFGGRRLVRVDGGFIVLNYIKYRDKDHSAAERMRRYRARKAGAAPARETYQEDEDGLRF